ncbi:MAG: B12-binding domain-containing radical SAM protein [Myxococcota bacterium]
MPKLMLINPHPPGNRGEEDIKVIVQMPLNLGYIAALTPRDEWEVDVIDEAIEPAIDENGKLNFEADLVGITTLTYQAPRSYQIAQAAREAGMKVVFGGAHTTTHPDEVGQYADAIGKGEAEPIWSRFLEDFKKGQLEPVYDGGLPDLSILNDVRPDRDLLTDKYGYKFSSIVTTKGCPWRCEFCCVPVIQGHKYRMRPVEHILDEMEEIPYQGLMLAEDNFYGYSKEANAHARAVFKGMIDRGINKTWFGFTQFSTGLDVQGLDYMARSGGLGMLIGIETTDAQILRKLRKGPNLKIGVDNFGVAIDNIHKSGMIVWGSMIFGADGEGPDTFKRAVDFVRESGIDVMTFGLLTSMPGSHLWKRLDDEGRKIRTNFPEDWIYYNSGHLTHLLESMSLDDFVDGMQYVYDNLYSKQALRERAFDGRRRTGNSFNSMFAYRINLDWKGVFQHVLKNLRLLQESGIYYEAERKRRKVA